MLFKRRINAIECLVVPLFYLADYVHRVGSLTKGDEAIFLDYLERLIMNHYLTLRSMAGKVSELGMLRNCRREYVELTDEIKKLIELIALSIKKPDPSTLINRLYEIMTRLLPLYNDALSCTEKKLYSKLIELMRGEIEDLINIFDLITR